MQIKISIKKLIKKKRKSKFFMINYFLFFKSSSLNRKYLQYLNQRFFKCIIFLDLFIISDLIYIIINMIICLSNNEGYFYFTYIKTVIFTIISSVWLVFFSISSIYLHFKQKTYSDILLLISYFYFLVLSAKIFTDPLLSFALGYIVTLFNILFMTVYRYYLVKIIHLICNLIYFAVFFWNAETGNKELIYTMIIILTALVMILIYIIEKNEKSIFLKTYIYEKEKKTFNELMNILPGGVAIFQKNMKELFINNSMKLLYEEDDNGKIREKIFKETKKKSVIVSEININPSSEFSADENASFKNFLKKPGLFFTKIYFLRI